MSRAIVTIITDDEFQGRTTTINSKQIRDYFFGVDFPAHRDDLMRIAGQAGASDDDIRVLHGLPDRNYSGVFDINGALKDSQTIAGHEVA